MYKKNVVDSRVCNLKMLRHFEKIFKRTFGLIDCLRNE